MTPDHAPTRSVSAPADGVTAHEAAPAAAAPGATTPPPMTSYQTISTPAQVAGKRSILQQTLRDTFARAGARTGLVWILILATAGVFAPFLANSDPIYVVDQAGRASSPLLHSLTPADITLAALYIVALMLWTIGRTQVGASLLILAIAGAAVWIPAQLFSKPEDAKVYEYWRVLQADGGVKKITRTIVPFSPNDRANDTDTVKLRPPSRSNWLGTSIFGEDVLSRMIHACRVALTIGLISTSISVAIGVIVGGFMGYFAGIFDLLAMRVIEIVEAIPALILLLIVTVFFGRSLYLMMGVIGLISWTSNARFIRAEFLRLRNLDFVAAARALGLPQRSIIFRHMLPNGISPVLVNASFGVAGAILLEATLSFLGLGLGPEDPSWGQLLNQARSGGTGFNWWIALFPGLAIFLTVFSYVLIGEAMRDALDPKLRKRE